MLKRTHTVYLLMLTFAWACTSEPVNVISGVGPGPTPDLGLPDQGSGPGQCNMTDDCNERFYCEQGVCVELPRCETDSDCAEQFRCIDGACEGLPTPIRCANDNDCPAEQPACINRICGELQAGRCRSDLDCPVNEMCIAMECIPGSPLDECQVDNQCPGQEVCVNGRCEMPPPECESDAQCRQNETCIAGSCNYEGPGLCSRDCAYDNDGSGDDGGPNANFSLCDFGSDCRDCGPRCRSNDECREGEECIEGSCVGGAEVDCRRDRECPDGQRCVNRTCRPQPPQNCGADTDCPPGNFCDSGQCRAGARPCAANADCEATQSCVAGQCRPNGEDGCLRPRDYSLGQLVEADSNGLSQVHQANCGNGANGPEAVFRLQPDAAGTICLTTRDSSFDTVLHVRASVCEDNANEIQCNDDDLRYNIASGLTSTVEFEAEADTDYFIFVDGYGENNAGTFRLSSSAGPCEAQVPPACSPRISCIDDLICSNSQCVECQGNADCESPNVCRGGLCTLPTTQLPRIGDCIDPVPIDGFGRFEGTNRMAEDRYQGSCGGRGGENILAYEAPQAGLICIDADGSAYDTVIYVRSDSCGGREIACNDDGIGIQSQLEFMAVEGAPYFIFVDGYSGTGDFVIRIRPGACPE